MTNCPYTREQAARRAELNTHNMPGLCQLWTRSIFGAPAVGDVDHDGDSDAVDGWKSEAGHQHYGDQNPPRGVPLAWSGGRFGHRAVSLGHGMVRSIDINGRVGTVSLDWFSRNWPSYHYLGWSDSMSGWLIQPLATVARKTNLQIAREVIAGRWGTGATRIALLKKAGYNPTVIQALVNQLLG